MDGAQNGTTLSTTSESAAVNVADAAFDLQ